MIKLKLTKDQLFSLCSFTRANIFENEAVALVRQRDFIMAGYAFNLMAIGERAAKLYLFGREKKISIGLSPSEACTLLEHVRALNSYAKDYDIYVANIIKTDLHYQLINYQKRFYGDNTPRTSAPGNGN